MTALEWIGAAHLLADAAVVTFFALVWWEHKRRKPRHGMTREQSEAIRARVKQNRRVNTATISDDDEHAVHLGGC